MVLRKKAAFNATLAGDISNNKWFRIGTYGVLGVVALGMTILNFSMQKGWLTMATAIFAGVCAVSIVLTLIGEICGKIAKVIFAAAVVCMFTFFLVSGNPEGFSAIWICMLPSLGMFFFDRYRGTILCAVMFFILVFFLWVPAGEQLLMYNYTATFKMRFPVLFLAFHALAYLLETLRANAHARMQWMQDYYQDLSIRDQLTGMFNRQGMYSTLESEPKYAADAKLGVAMFDVDFFKSVNDRYGHNVGDEVLKSFAAILKSTLGCLVCRWGGEEFVAVFTEDELGAEDWERVRRVISEQRFTAGEETFGITASIGVCSMEGVPVAQIDSLIGRADEALYRAKTTGRNRVIYCEEQSTTEQE